MSTFKDYLAESVKSYDYKIKVAGAIDKDFANKMRFTRKWGKGAFDGQRVEKNHTVEDGDILEFHI